MIQKRLSVRTNDDESLLIANRHNLRVEVGQRPAQQLRVALVGAALELFQDALAGEHQAGLLVPGLQLFGSDGAVLLVRGFGDGFFDLGFHRLALPTTGHASIVADRIEETAATRLANHFATAASPATLFCSWIS